MPRRSSTSEVADDPPALIAVEAAGDDWFVDQLRAIWEAGDAILPVDPRLPEPARHALLDAMEPVELRCRSGAVDHPSPQRSGRSTPLEEGDALVIATSGSTGTAKGVVHTHASLAASADITSRALDVDPAVDHWLACLPLSHVGGFSVVTRALLTGCALTVEPRPSAEAIGRAVDRGATRCSLVPAVLDAMDVSAFTTVLLGGGAIPLDRPPNCVATYGSTETGSGIVYDGHALDGVEITAVDGELWVRSPTLGRRYRDGAPLTDDDGWFHTGDAGDVDPDGLVTVTGRIAEVIVTGGEKVWPSVVERCVEHHPGVAEAVVFGRPDPRWGMAVAAVVVPVDPGAPPSLAEVRGWVKRTLPAYAAPHRVEVVDRLPRLASGKVDRRAVTAG